LSGLPCVMSFVIQSPSPGGHLTFLCRIFTDKNALPDEGQDVLRFMSGIILSSS